jgi:hypothetical protein
MTKIRFSISLLIAFTLLSIFKVNAQCYNAGTPFIIVDKDGYTNVREYPDGSSKIVGKVYKYQVFFSLDNECKVESYATDKWEPITYGSGDGYIYKNNIMSTFKLPSIGLTLWTASKKNIISNGNDSINIAVEFQSFDYQNYKKADWVYGGTSADFDDNIKNKSISNQINELKIKYREQTIVLPQEKIKKYCDVGCINLSIGFEGDLYLSIEGGFNVGKYAVWFSIVNGEIMYESMSDDDCW